LPLFTIGYEKAKPEAVLRELTHAKVDVVVDTRAVAASRRPGFSKKQLAAGLNDVDIAYLHLQKLGTPAEGREAARAGDFKTLWRIYDKHIAKSEPQRELGELAALIKSGQRVALLCYCRDPKGCHRSRTWKREGPHRGRGRGPDPAAVLIIRPAGPPSACPRC
jgi:uncharacterized protein (DUF488 family)